MHSRTVTQDKGQFKKELILAYSVNHMSELEEYLNNIENKDSYEIRIINSATKMLSLIEFNKIHEIVFYETRDITIDGKEHCIESAINLFKGICSKWHIKITILKDE
jgi:hypothetical protein